MMSDYRGKFLKGLEDRLGVFTGLLCVIDILTTLFV